MTVMLILRIILLFTALAWIQAGCSFSVKGQKLKLLPGTSVAPRTVETGGGEQTHWERTAPEGDTFFLSIRGQL